MKEIKEDDEDKYPIIKGLIDDLRVFTNIEQK